MKGDGPALAAEIGCDGTPDPVRRSRYQRDLGLGRLGDLGFIHRDRMNSGRVGCKGGWRFVAGLTERPGGS